MTVRVSLRCVLVALGLAVFAPAAIAQTPADEWPHAVAAAPAPANDHQAKMAEMRTAAEQLTALVAQMDAAPATEKIGPMAAILRELVAKQLKMMDCMAKMHEGGGMGEMMQKMKGMPPSAASETPDPAADGHEQHHPDGTLKP